MKIKTANLTGKALDWALNHALMLEHGFVPEIAGALGEPSEMYEHTDPAVCLGLIKQYRANIDQVEHAPKVQVTIWYEITDSDGEDFDADSAIGDTIEQAVARCVCLMHLGEWVDMPIELCSLDVS